MDKFLLGQYTISERLGSGGMGCVYRGRDSQSGQTVAIKVLKHEALAHNSDAIERFKREGEALRTLNHPNIVKILATDQVNDQHYLVMEYVEGGSLTDLLTQQGLLSVERVVAIALELADALTRAHHLDIIHRDLKPDNVLIATDGTPRLTDFGLARLGGKSALTESQHVVGTLYYLSPEALNGEDLDARTDIWAFGVMLYEMLTGVRPFRGQHAGSLISAILTDSPSPELNVLRPDVPTALIDLIHRMLQKDRDVRIPSVRLVAAELWAIKEGVADSLSATSHVSTQIACPEHNLPSQSTTFIGRQSEIDDISTLLADPNCRLLTLVGAGGMGKSRLALQVAEQMLDNFADGVWLVELAPLASHMSLVPTMLATLNLQHISSSTSTVDQRKVLLDFLREKSLLLVLDNFEHLLEASDLIDGILKVAQKVEILITSREAVRIEWEWVYDVRGMDIPPLDDDDIEGYSGVRLFADRAKRTQSQFNLASEGNHVAQICQILDGMPLGIELAASWLRVLSCEELVTELTENLGMLESRHRTVTDRHQSLRTVFDHSWRLLSDDERNVLMKLSVFHGYFSREAAQAVTDATLSVLSGLVDKSLLRLMPTGCYDLHQLVHQFAAAELDRQPNAKQVTLDRHAVYYCQFMGERLPDMKGSRMIQAWEEISAAFDNIRAAWDHAIERKNLSSIAQALESLYYYYFWRQQMPDGHLAFSKAVDAFNPLNVAFEPTIGKLLVCHAHTQVSIEKNDATLGILEDCIAEFRAISDVAGLVFALEQYGWALYQLRSFSEAETAFSECLSMYQSQNDLFGQASALEALGQCVYKLNRYPEARKLYHEALRISSLIQNAFSQLLILKKLALLNYRSFEYDAAEANYRAALKIAEQLNIPVDIIIISNSLGLIIMERDSPQDAVPYIQKSFELSNKLGNRQQQAMTLLHLAQLEMYLGNLDQAELHFLEGLDYSKSVVDHRRICATYLYLSMLALLQHDYDEAKHYADIAMQIAETKVNSYIYGARLAMGHVSVMLGEDKDAKQHYRQVLTFALDHGYPSVQLEGLAGVARLLRNKGEPQLAVEIATLAINHHQTIRDVKLIGEPLLEELEAELPVEEFEAAVGRGKGLDLDRALDIVLEHPALHVDET